MARTKAARISAKRGRKKVVNVEREPNGRISRSKEPPSKLALEARARMMQISIEAAKDQKAGTYLGLLHMAYLAWEKSRKSKNPEALQPEQSLSTAQYHALLSAKEMHNDYLKAIGAPGAHYDPYFGDGGDPDAHARWCAKAKEKWEKVKATVREAQFEDRTSNLWAALDYCVIQEQSMPHMILSLKSLGNVLARSFQRG